MLVGKSFRMCGVQFHSKSSDRKRDAWRYLADAVHFKCLHAGHVLHEHLADGGPVARVLPAGPARHLRHLVFQRLAKLLVEINQLLQQWEQDTQATDDITRKERGAEITMLTIKTKE